MKTILFLTLWTIGAGGLQWTGYRYWGKIGSWEELIINIALITVFGLIIITAGRIIN